MLVGDLALLVALVNILALGLNIGWMYNNWRVRKQANNYLILAHRIHDDALAGEYKLCSSCGRIVQGICLQCTANLPVEE